jgi:hypothetical protein
VVAVSFLERAVGSEAEAALRVIELR